MIKIGDHHVDPVDMNRICKNDNRNGMFTLSFGMKGSDYIGSADYSTEKAIDDKIQEILIKRKEIEGKLEEEGNDTSKPNG